MKLLILLAAVAFLSCDATRPPCAEDNDCFVGEQCVQTSCVPKAVPDMSMDAEVDQNTQDCRINPGICEPSPCNTATGKCISCEFDKQCGQNGLCDVASGECACAQGFHRCGTQCLSDVSNDSCGDRCTSCPHAPNGFGFCDRGDCAIGCNTGWLRCDESCDVSPLECVKCLNNSNCGTESPVCDSGNCTACRNDSDCGAHPDSPVCHNGECVECTEAKKEKCGGRTCDPATDTCTETLIKSVRTCESCVSDDDCYFASEDCVKMKFRNVDRPGGYCLYRKTTQYPCYRPYINAVERPTLSGGEPTQYCTLNETEFTCEALSTYGVSCSNDEDCGTPDLNDGLCKSFTDRRRCTYSCDSGEDCPLPPGGHTCVSYCRDVRN